MEATDRYNEPLVTTLHDMVLYPIVRVTAEKAMGSGTIVYSALRPGKTDAFETYVLTNEHVIDGNIKIETKWSSLLRRESKIDILSECGIETFEFEYGSWESGQAGFKADIVAYDKEMDLALLRLKSGKKFPHVAKLFPKGQEKERLRQFMKLMAVGCGLGHAPLVTEGVLTGFTDVIDNYPYYLSSAPTIFGNSGGAVFLKQTMEFIGIPSRIAVTMTGFSANPITHMSFFIPISSVYKFFDRNIFQFIYDAEYTSEKCARLRKEKRERDAKTRVTPDDEKGEDRADDGSDPGYDPDF